MRPLVAFESVGVLLAILLLGAGSVAVLANPPICASNGYTNGAMVCTGTCPQSPPSHPSPYPCPNPPQGVGNDPVNGDYTFCACDGEGESNCCHLIRCQRPPHIRVKGVCSTAQMCPPDGNCRRTGQGDGTDPYESFCDTTPD
jgi:hypothetical protein